MMGGYQWYAPPGISEADVRRFAIGIFPRGVGTQSDCPNPLKLLFRCEFHRYPYLLVSEPDPRFFEGLVPRLISPCHNLCTQPRPQAPKNKNGAWERGCCAQRRDVGYCEGYVGGFVSRVWDGGLFYWNMSIFLPTPPIKPCRQGIPLIGAKDHQTM